MLTEEQRAADAAVRDAIERAVRAYELLPDDATMVDFVVVVEGLRYHADDSEGHDEFRALLYREGVARTSVALGLLKLGQEMIHDTVRDNPVD